MPEGLSITFNDKKRVEEKRVKDIIILGGLVYYQNETTTA